MSKLKKSTPFVVHLVLPIDDVQKQIQEKTTVTSAGFKCEDDPTPREFTLKADFGSSTADFLSFSWLCKSELKGLTGVFNQLSIVDQDGSLLIADKDRATLALNSITARKMAILFHLQYVPDASIPDPASDSTTQFQWQRDFLAKLESGDDTDFTFIVKGEEVAAHKLILSTRSEYFQRMFETEMQESASNRVEVPDVEPATFRNLMKFIYGGVMEEKEWPHTNWFCLRGRTTLRGCLMRRCRRARPIESKFRTWSQPPSET